MRGSVSVKPSRRRRPGRGPHALLRQRPGWAARSRRGSGSRASPAAGRRSSRGFRAASAGCSRRRWHQKAYSSSSLLEEGEQVGVGVARGARQAVAARGRPAGEGERALPRPGGDLGLLLLAQGGDEVGLEIEQPRHHPRRSRARGRSFHGSSGWRPRLERAPRRPAGAPGPSPPGPRAASSSRRGAAGNRGGSGRGPPPGPAEAACRRHSSSMPKRRATKAASGRAASTSRRERVSGVEAGRSRRGRPAAASASAGVLPREPVEEGAGRGPRGGRRGGDPGT